MSKPWEEEWVSTTLGLAVLQPDGNEDYFADMWGAVDRGPLAAQASAMAVPLLVLYERDSWEGGPEHDPRIAAVLRAAGVLP